MYLGSWKIDDWLTFPVNTHNASTGAATDADAVPSYRVYEDETATPILTGSMAKLDDANTTGFYSERIQLTAANGFEAGKSYTIYISAAVASVTGTISHTFQMQAEVALHADWINGGRLDLLIDAIKAVTDLLPDAGALTTLITHLTDIKGATWSGATDSLEAIRDRGDLAWITGGGGGGSISWEYTLTDGDPPNDPIADADIWVTTDQAGSNIVASGKTDNFGKVTFFLDAGTYYVWRQKGGWNFDNPDTEIVS